MARQSYIRYEGMPSAILSDGLVTVPLYAVSQIGLSETYHLPPIGTSNVRSRSSAATLSPPAEKP